ncbi:MAG: ribonuclease D [Opitutales bacterium]|nr:ribonuclease D [Opitutales bacterium]
METDYTFINQQEELERFLPVLEQGETVCLDTEADNMHHYETRLCLLQIGVEDQVALVDPLGDLDWTPLLGLMEKKRLVMHGSDFDFRLLSQHGGFRPKNLFDTMHAAQLLGLPKIGLGFLAEHYLGIKMTKGHQKSDWSKRPLPPKMLTYAALDAHILHGLKEVMEKEIRDAGREEWLRERCQWQVEQGNIGFAEKDKNAWRILSWRNLSPRGLVNLYYLYQWREKRAKEWDLPPFKVLHNEMLFGLAKAAQDFPHGDWRKAMTPRLFKSRGKDLENVLRQAAAASPKDLPPPPPRKLRPDPLTPEELGRQAEMQKKRDQVAREMGIDPSLVANRQQLTLLARDPSLAEELLLPTPRRLLGLSASSPQEVVNQKE